MSMLAIFGVFFMIGAIGARVHAYQVAGSREELQIEVVCTGCGRLFESEEAGLSHVRGRHKASSEGAAKTLLKEVR